MTTEEIKQIERVFKKPISEIDKIDIPSYIKRQDREEAEAEYWAEQSVRSDEQELENAQRPE